jgi:hypothetical protein
MNEDLNIDFILQGPVSPETKETALNLLNYSRTNKVIISTWEGENIDNFIDDRILVIYNKKLINPGKNNRNRQIYSTYEGLKMCCADIAVKMRTDQRYSLETLELMYNYFINNYKIDEKFVNNLGPKGAIFTITLYANFPFHPQDHLFYGFREDLLELFNIPLDSEYPPEDMLENPTDYGIRTDFLFTDTRPNTYIGMYYYSKFDTNIEHMVNNYREYIVDKAPRFNEAMVYDIKYKNKIFKAFPKLNVFWYKHNRPYPYEWGNIYGEYSS